MIAARRGACEHITIPGDVRQGMYRNGTYHNEGLRRGTMRRRYDSGFFL